MYEGKLVDDPSNIVMKEGYCKLLLDITKFKQTNIGSFPVRLNTKYNAL